MRIDLIHLFLAADSVSASTTASPTQCSNDNYIGLIHNFDDFGQTVTVNQDTYHDTCSHGHDHDGSGTVHMFIFCRR